MNTETLNTLETVEHIEDPSTPDQFPDSEGNTAYVTAKNTGARVTQCNSVNG